MNTRENNPFEGKSSRREFIKTTGKLAAAGVLAGVSIPYVHAAGSDLIQVALVGCGGRGTGAASQALSTKGGPIKLVAMADVFGDKMTKSYENLAQRHKDQVDVSPDKKFIGFDAYKKAMDCLKPGDVAIFATPPAFRWVHFAYALQKGINAFLEKPITVDGPTSKRMLQQAEEAEKKNLKVGIGLMVRHCRGRQELLKRIQDGQIGDIICMRAYRMQSGGGATGPKPQDMTETLYQVRRFHSFLWASGGIYSDNYIHQIDECCWMKGAWPIQAQALGGRHYKGNSVDQNFDVYAVEYVFADGTRLFYDGRHIQGCHNEFASYAHGSKGSAIVSTSSHTPGRVRIFKSHVMDSKNLVWAFPQPEPNPYQLEWDDLIDAIRNDKPYNELRRGVEASLVTSMGRMAAHTGQIITYEQMLNCPHEFAPDADKLTPDAPAPLKADKDGKYPVPMPGIKKDREY